jgi:hypothetical protein
MVTGKKSPAPETLREAYPDQLARVTKAVRQS